MFAGIAALVAAAIGAASAIGSSVSASNQAKKAKRQAADEAQDRATREKRMAIIEALGGDPRTGFMQINNNRDAALKKISQVDDSINWAPIASSLGNVANAVGGIADRIPSSSYRTPYPVPDSATDLPMRLGSGTDQTVQKTMSAMQNNNNLSNLGDWKLGQDPNESPYSLINNNYSRWRY